METGDVFKIQITKSCLKQIDRAPTGIRQAVDKAIRKISESPCKGIGIKAMTGNWSGYYRYRLGSYRIIYRVEHDTITVFVVSFGTRGDIYK